jgi:hypothetical protein
MLKEGANMNVSRMQASAWALAGLLAGTANANVLVDNFEEGSVDSQAGPYSDYQGHWVESIETGLPPADVIGGARRTSVYGWMSDWQSAHLTGGAMRFHLDEDLLYDAGLRYESLGGLALHGSGIALDVNYDLTGGRDTAVFLRLALSDTHGGSGTASS